MSSVSNHAFNSQVDLKAIMSSSQLLQLKFSPTTTLPSKESYESLTNIF